MFERLLKQKSMHSSSEQFAPIHSCLVGVYASLIGPDHMVGCKVDCHEHGLELQAHQAAFGKQLL